MDFSSTLIFGCGYLGQRVGRLLFSRGEDLVYGTTRSQGKADRLAKIGIRPILLDVTDPGVFPRLPTVESVLYCVGFDRGAGQSIRQVYVDGFRRVLDALADQQPGCPIVYAGSTGVYGGSDGGWVDETSPVDPQTESGRACLDAERMLETYPGPSIILRYAGLYGPGRIMRRDSLIRGEPVVGSPDKFLNFIQIDDAATVTVVALDEVARGDRGLFLISDGHPLTRSEFYGATAEFLLAPPPRFESPVPGSLESRREESNKRVDNRKMLGRWGAILRHPDIRSGLAASLKAES